MREQVQAESTARHVGLAQHWHARCARVGDSDEELVISQHGGDPERSGAGVAHDIGDQLRNEQTHQLAPCVVDAQILAPVKQRVAADGGCLRDSG